MIPRVALEVRPLQLQVGHLVDDLRRQVSKPEQAELLDKLRKQHAGAVKADRLSATFESWLTDVLDNAAVAWVLSCVFVRFCEDNGLVGQVWLGGPEEKASVDRALANRQAHLIANPLQNDRDWLYEAFGYLKQLKATGRLFDKHNPLWEFQISGTAAETLSDFFRKGAGFVSLRSEDWNTRFLGELYQHLSEHARKTYALLQTPEFVEEFILDRTMKPAIEEFGLAGIKLIDPACGSGHFLLGAFAKLLALWEKQEPRTPIRTLVDRALDQVVGVDINPFAVSIARFRLLVEAMRHYGVARLEDCPVFPIKVATGDSLLPWGDDKTIEEATLTVSFEPTEEFSYSWEDEDLLKDLLTRGQYTVVVGNPPYITVKDSVLNTLYRKMYTTCHRQYALSVPFAERFFQLAKRGDHGGNGAGMVGQITSNSFMKREFGTKLVNEFFASEVELTEVIDTSGAHIPSHGTPTVILIGRRRRVSRRYSGPIRAMLGIQGEPEQPDDPRQGLVWQAILKQIDTPSETKWISSVDLNRDQLATHPWSLTGGGTDELMSKLDTPSHKKLARIAELPIGRAIRAGADEAYIRPITARTHTALWPLVVGEIVRDWKAVPQEGILFPYDSNINVVDLEAELWNLRSVLAARRTFQGNMQDAGLTWWEYMQYTSSAYRTPLAIAFAFVATHNQFILDRGGKVFKQSAPVIKLPETASEADHLQLLGVLNSSTACFWLKQVSHDKGIRGEAGGFTSSDWERFYEFTGTKVEQFPLPGTFPLELARRLDGLAQRLGEVSPGAVCTSDTGPSRQILDEAKTEYFRIRAEMIALQEELDWDVYQRYDLIGDDLSAVDNPEPLKLGERTFEIIMARDKTETAWFDRHGSTPITELPAHWSAEYKDLVERRIVAIRADRNLQLLERPECKRRWSFDSWDKLVRVSGWEKLERLALEAWLLERLEAPRFWRSTTPQSAAELAEKLRDDGDFRQVAMLWSGRDEVDQSRNISELIKTEHVPFLASYRYKPSGLNKRAQWERCWRLQRQEDAGDKVEIQVPPKYASADFLNSSFWSQRGKLDVPKERFVSYPQLSRDGDPTLLLGWAGWDHEQQAKALATLYLDRKNKAGWPADRLLPVLAGLAELEPWLHQWHGEYAAGYPESPAAFYTGLIDTELAVHGADRMRLTTLRGVEQLS